MSGHLVTVGLAVAFAILVLALPVSVADEEG